MLRQLTPATTLIEIYKTLSTEPLEQPEELKAFYRSELNQARGKDIVARMQRLLANAYQSVPYRTFLMGHLGVGKSTEMSRLIQQIQGQFEVIRLSAKELDPVGFKVFDVLILMIMEITERTIKIPGVNSPSFNRQLEEFQRWFDVEKRLFTEATDVAGSVVAGAGMTGENPIAKIFGFFGQLRGEIKYATTRKREVVEYRLSRIPELVSLANKILIECNQLLGEVNNKEWIFIWEDFDKRIAPERIEELFITNGSVFADLNVHAIFNLPIGLGYSGRAKQLPFDCVAVPDTPIFTADHQLNEDGLLALRAIVKTRVQLNLFASDQLDRLIIASGGNIRDLFSMIIFAATSAAECISEPDVTQAINDLRLQYRNRLGTSEYDKDKIEYSEKAKRLIAIYNREPESDIPSPVLYVLLRSRAVLEFNGRGWFGVHPLVVDILADQGRIEPDATGKVPGGSN